MIYLSDTTKIVLSIVLIIVVTAATGFIFKYGQIDNCHVRARERQERLQQKWRDPFAFHYYQANPRLRPNGNDNSNENTMKFDGFQDIFG